MSAQPAPSPLHLLRVHSAQVNVVSFSDDNERLYSGDASGYAAITSLRSLRSLSEWPAHSDGLLGIQEWGKHIITHGRDNKLHVWANVDSPTSVGDSVSLPGLPTPSLCYSMDVNALNFCRFSLWPLRESSQAETQRALIALPNLVDSTIADIWMLPSCQRIHAAIGKDKSSSTTSSDARDGRKTGIIMSMQLFQPPHESGPERATLRLLCGYEDGSVAMWAHTRPDMEMSVEGRGWVMLWTVKLHVESVMAMALSSDYTHAITVSADHLICQYALSEAEKPDFSPEIGFTVHRIKQAGNASVAYRHDGRVCAVGGWDGKVRLYSTKTFKPLGTLTYHKNGCQVVAFANAQPLPDEEDDEEDELTFSEKVERNRWLAAGGRDHRISIWALMDFERPRTNQSQA